MLRPLPESGFCPVCGEFEDECECPQYPATMDKYRVEIRLAWRPANLLSDKGSAESSFGVDGESIELFSGERSGTSPEEKSGIDSP